MTTNTTASERKLSDFIRFGLGFFGFILGLTGIVLTVPGLALTGGLLLLLVITSYALGGED